MGYLHILNVSPQRRVISYRLDINKSGEFDERLRNRAALQQTIESGKQAVVGGDLHVKQMERIIDQLTPYGLVSVQDVPNNIMGVVPLVFSIDAPVPRHIGMQVVQHNLGAKLEEGAVRRERAAVAANVALKNVIDAQPQVFDVEFEQEEVSELDESPIAIGFHVKEEEGKPAPKPGRRRAA